MKFFSNNRGNVATFTALALVPIAIMSGFMIEFGRQQGFARQTQASLDSAILFAAVAANSGVRDHAELSRMTQLAFDENFGRQDEISLSQINITLGEENLTAEVDASMPTYLVSLLGVEKLDFSVNAGARFGNAPSTPLELVLVVDVSESMKGANIAALRNASKDLFDILLPDDETSSARVGIVPFNHYVNIGTRHDGASWLGDTSDREWEYESCPVNREASRENGCTFEQVCERDSGNDEVGRQCRTETSCPAGVEVVRDPCQTIERQAFWLGCVDSRAQPLRVQDGGYDANPIIPAFQNRNAQCLAKNEVLELTNDKRELDRAMQRLKPVWDTYIPTGLTWGLRVLSDIEPYSSSTVDPASGRQAILLMSDGANTRSVSGTNHWGTNEADANTTMISACDEIKDTGILIYVVDYGITNGVTEELLESCATSDDHYFEADSPGELRDAFAEIAGRFAEVALTL